MHNICIYATQGWYPVMYAVKEGHIEIVKECFDLVDHAITTKVHVHANSVHHTVNDTYNVSMLLFDIDAQGERDQ
jgi:hypothetical protein